MVGNKLVGGKTLGGKMLRYRFHVYKSSEWKDIKIGDHVTIERETSQESLKVDRYFCAVKAGNEHFYDADAFFMI